MDDVDSHDNRTGHVRSDRPRSLLVTNQSYVNSVPRHWVVLDTWVGDDS